MLPGTAGNCRAVLFNSEGDIQQLLHLSANGPTHGIEVAEDQFHSRVALEADSVIFELKQGPYQPAQDKDFLNGFPQEGTAEAAGQEAQWRSQLAGSGLT